MHLSRLGAELVLWSTANSASASCRRLVIGLLDHAAEEEPRRRRAPARQGAPRRRPPAALLGVKHGLPLTYNKDLQEDKEHLFDAADTIAASLAAARGMLGSVQFDRERLAAAASDEFARGHRCGGPAGQAGVPFREAHGVVAGLVRGALERGSLLSELGDDELRAASDKLDPVAFRSLLASESWLESKVSEGGTASERITEQLAAARSALASGA